VSLKSPWWAVISVMVPAFLGRTCGLSSRSYPRLLAVCPRARPPASRSGQGADRRRAGGEQAADQAADLGVIIRLRSSVPQTLLAVE